MSLVKGKGSHKKEGKFFDRKAERVTLGIVGARLLVESIVFKWRIV